jgi:hypothetical protein
LQLMSPLKDAYAYARAFPYEFAKRRLKPLRNIEKYAAAVAKNLDQMKRVSGVGHGNWGYRCGRRL